MFRIQRVYDYKAGAPTGTYVLVDRLWPRGISKDRLRGVPWWKDIAPSDSLRRWFSHDPARWDEFKRRYFAELDGNGERVDELRALGKKRKVFLLYAAKDETHNHAAVLRDYLQTNTRTRR